VSSSLKEKNERLYEWIRQRIADATISGELLDGFQNSVTVVQTCDPYKYKDIFEVTRSHNEKVAKSIGMAYRGYVGIIRGCYAHHAAYNRTKILRDFVDDEYKGWIIYIDADSIIQNTSFDFIGNLSIMRENKKILWMAHDSPQDDYLTFNDGIFGIDLGSSVSRAIIKVWDDIYGTYYSDEDYQKATSWDDIVNDQTALSLIFRALGEKFGDFFVSKILYGCFQSHWKLGWDISNDVDNIFFSALRADAGGISGEEEMRLRIGAILKKISILPNSLA